MASTNYTTGTVVGSAWLNEVDAHVFDDTPPTGTTVHDANKISFVPATGPSTTVQTALRTAQADIDTLETTVAGLPTAGLPVGGTTGQVLTKNSGTNYDASWQDTGTRTIYVPVTLQLGGPDPDGLINYTTTGTWSFVGSALSSSAKRLLYSYGGIRVEYARMVAVWTTASMSNQIRLVHFDDGPANITEIGVITPSATGSPIATSLIVTSGLDALAAASQEKQIGYQVIGDGSSVTLYEIRVEIAYRYIV